MEKVILITGASRGIGKASAIEFAKLMGKGATIVINYRSNHKEAKCVADVVKSFGAKAIAVQADISKQEELEKMVDFVVSKFGRIDILINNAGIVFDREFEEIKYDEALQVLKTNMLAPLFLSQKVAPIMLKNEGGAIVNVSSTSGLDDVNPGTADYAMSKLALQALTRDLSAKYAPAIRVNAVAPGWVNTDMNKDLPKDFVKSETAKYHMKRWAQPEEIANVIAFLASDKASYVTGEVVVVNGGRS